MENTLVFIKFHRNNAIRKIFLIKLKFNLILSFSLFLSRLSMSVGCFFLFFAAFLSRSTSPRCDNCEKCICKKIYVCVCATTTTAAMAVCTAEAYQKIIYL